MPNKQPRTVYSLDGKTEYVWPEWYPPEDWNIPVRCKCGAFWYDPEEAWRWINWFPIMCKHPEGRLKGEPIELLTWQRGPTREAFGWRCRKPDGTLTKVRRYLDVFMGVAKKNSKTTWGAGLALAATELDKENSPQVFFCAGGNEEQAEDNGWRIAQKMIQGSEDLQEIFVPWGDLIEHPKSDGFIRLLSSAPTGKDGKNVHFVYVDEAFELTDLKMLNSLKTGMVARTQPMMIKTTTAGDDTNSPTHAEWEKCRAIIEGDVKAPRYLAVLYEMDPGDDWRDPEVWKKCNPGWGESVNMDILKAFYDEAVGDPVKEAAFRQYHCNSWESSVQVLIPPAEWDLSTEEYTLEDLYNEGGWQYVIGGLDFAADQDMSALALLLAKHDGNQIVYKTWVEYWLPEMTMQDRIRRGHKHHKWHKEGLLTETEGPITDHSAIRERAKEIRDKYFPKFKEIMFDPAFAGGIAPKMQKTDGFEMIVISQSYKQLGPATKELKDLVLAAGSDKTMDRKIINPVHPILRWNVENARAMVSSEQKMMLHKAKSKDKIDGLAAIVFALARVLVLPPPKKPLKAGIW